MKKLVMIIMMISVRCASACAFTHKSLTVDFESKKVIHSGVEYNLVDVKIAHKRFSRVIEYRTIRDNKMYVFYLEQFDNGNLKLTGKKFKN